MTHKHFIFTVITCMTLACVGVGCSSDDPVEPVDPDPIDTTTTDTTTVDTTDTTQIDTDTVVIPVDSTVYIKWSGTTATVELDEKLSDDITFTVNGGNVVVTNNNITDEFLFVLSGTSADGSFTYNGSFKASMQFDGLNLTSTTGAAVDIQCGKRIKLQLTDDTQNSLTDAPNGTQKAAFNCQGHLEVSGSGSLTIAGNTNHGLRTNEYLLLKQSTGAITITAAAADGIHCGEFYQQNGGTVTISGNAKDGLQVETDDESDEAQNGLFILNDGTLTVTVTAEDAKAVRLDAAETNTAITPQMYILGGTMTVNVATTANGSKGIACDGNITIGNGQEATPVVTVNVDGGQYTDPETEEKNRATGIKADNTLLIAGGNTTVEANGKKSRGVRAATLRATAGTLTVNTNGSSSQGIKLDNTFTSEGGTVTSKFTY